MIERRRLLKPLFWLPPLSAVLGAFAANAQEADCTSFHRQVLAVYKEVERSHPVTAALRAKADNILQEACGPRYRHCAFSICAEELPDDYVEDVPAETSTPRPSPRPTLKRDSSVAASKRKKQEEVLSGIRAQLAQRTKKLQEKAEEEKKNDIEWKPFVAETWK